MGSWVSEAGLGAGVGAGSGGGPWGGGLRTPQTVPSGSLGHALTAGHGGIDGGPLPSIPHRLLCGWELMRDASLGPCACPRPMHGPSLGASQLSDPWACPLRPHKPVSILCQGHPYKQNSQGNTGLASESRAPLGAGPHPSRPLPLELIPGLEEEPGSPLPEPQLGYHLPEPQLLHLWAGLSPHAPRRVVGGF